MTPFDEALNLVVARTGVERYRYLCSDAHHDNARWRAWVIDRAANITRADYGPEPPGPAPYDTSWLPGPCGGCR